MKIIEFYPDQILCIPLCTRMFKSIDFCNFVWANRNSKVLFMICSKKKSLKTVQFKSVHSSFITLTNCLDKTIRRAQDNKAIANILT